MDEERTAAETFSARYREGLKIRERRILSGSRRRGGPGEGGDQDPRYWHKPKKDDVL